MNDSTVDLDQTEAETLNLFTDEVSDDALEAAAGGTGLPVMTMGLALVSCPVVASADERWHWRAKGSIFLT
jgi:hypothetical protein